MVTEVEMKEFFQQVVDTVASLSTQASQVEALRQQVNDLTARIDNLEQENRNLRQQVETANNDAVQWSIQAEQHKSAATAANEHVIALRDTIVGRDTKVSELEGKLRDETDYHRITKAELEDARRAVAEWEANYIKTKDELAITATSRDLWQSRADEARKEADEYKAKLDRLQSILNPPDLRVVSGQVG